MVTIHSTKRYKSIFPTAEKFIIKFTHTSGANSQLGVCSNHGDPSNQFPSRISPFLSLTADCEFVKILYNIHDSNIPLLTHLCEILLMNISIFNSVQRPELPLVVNVRVVIFLIAISIATYLCQMRLFPHSFKEIESD